jgi:hypothetical protein
VRTIFWILAFLSAPFVTILVYVLHRDQQKAADGRIQKNGERKLAVRDVYKVGFGTDENEKFWWFAERDGKPLQSGGPFDSHEAADKDVQQKLFGHKKIAEGDVLDSNWDKPQ